MNEIRNRPLAALNGDEPKIALVSYDSLGDGLVYLMMAENLRLNGFRVTYYGNRISDLAGWFPQLSVRPYPEDLEAELRGFDLVLYCPPSFVRHRLTEVEMRRLAERYVTSVSVGIFPSHWRVDHTERIGRTAAAEPDCKMASCSGPSGTGSSRRRVSCRSRSPT